MELPIFSEDEGFGWIVKMDLYFRENGLGEEKGWKWCCWPWEGNL